MNKINEGCLERDLLISINIICNFKAKFGINELIESTDDVKVPNNAQLIFDVKIYSQVSPSNTHKPDFFIFHKQSYRNITIHNSIHIEKRNRLITMIEFQERTQSNKANSSE